MVFISHSISDPDHITKATQATEFVKVIIGFKNLPHPWFSMKEYLGDAFTSGTAVATQEWANTRRGTWLYWITEASMCRTFPR